MWSKVSPIPFSQALGMLFWHKHNIEKSLADLPNFTPFPDEWTVEDKVLFEQAFSFHGKTFHRIQQMVSGGLLFCCCCCCCRCFISASYTIREIVIINFKLICLCACLSYVRVRLCLQCAWCLQRLEESEYQIWSRSSKHLRAAMWALGIEPMAFEPCL